MIGPKPLRIKFDKINGLIRIYDGTRYLILLALKNMILFAIELDISKVKKVVPRMFFCPICEKSKLALCLLDSLPIEKTLSLDNVTALINSVLNKHQCQYCSNVFLEKCSY